MFRRFGRVVMAGALALALVVIGWVFYSRTAFGTWNPFSQPNRIVFCDRTYYPGPHAARAQVDATGNGFGVFPIRQVGITGAGAPIYARPLPDSVRHQLPNGPVLPCAMVVYFKVGADDYVAYGISGGP